MGSLGNRSEPASGTLIDNFRSSLARTAAIEMRAPAKSYKCFAGRPAICLPTASKQFRAKFKVCVLIEQH